MNLIESIIIDGNVFSFFDGIDFDIIMNHPKDGTEGFIFCFVDSWVKEVKKWERESKIDHILKNKLIKKFNSQNIENNYVSIYQLDGIDYKILKEIVKQKILNNNFSNQFYIPLSSGISSVA